MPRPIPQNKDSDTYGNMSQRRENPRERNNSGFAPSTKTSKKSDLNIYKPKKKMNLF